MIDPSYFIAARIPVESWMEHTPKFLKLICVHRSKPVPDNHDSPRSLPPLADPKEQDSVAPGLIRDTAQKKHTRLGK